MFWKLHGAGHSKQILSSVNVQIVGKMQLVSIFGRSDSVNRWQLRRILITGNSVKLVSPMREESDSHAEVFSPSPCLRPHQITWLLLLGVQCLAWPHGVYLQQDLPDHPSLSGGLCATARSPWQCQGRHELFSQETAFPSAVLVIGTLPHKQRGKVKLK